jgi:hypothetical protein
MLQPVGDIAQGVEAVGLVNLVKPLCHQLFKITKIASDGFDVWLLRSWTFCPFSKGLRGRRSLIRIEEKDITNNNASGLRRAHQDLMIEIARLVQQDRPYGLPRGSSEDAG